MKKFTTVLGICCLLPLIVLVIIVLLNKKISVTKEAPNSYVAPLNQAIPLTGNSFPDFSITEINGEIITRDSLKGKPAIIWFTTTWCVPCQIGAKKVAMLDNELGGDKFNVLVIFVDSRESKNDLINWRNRFANPDWKLAFNNGLAEKIGIKYLDSKYLLDSNGMIKNIDFGIVDDRYLDLIRSIVVESKK